MRATGRTWSRWPATPGWAADLDQTASEVSRAAYRGHILAAYRRQKNPSTGNSARDTGLVACSSQLQVTLVPDPSGTNEYCPSTPATSPFIGPVKSLRRYR